MVISLDDLKREKVRLLKQAEARGLARDIEQLNIIEERKLKAEIKALKNPSSTRAKEVAMKLTLRSGKLIFSGGKMLGRHLVKLAHQETSRDRKVRVKKKTPMKKIKRRRKR